MNEELTAIKAAMDNADFDTARALADAYVPAHPDEFSDYYAIVEAAESETAAHTEVVQSVEALRNAGLQSHQYRAEAFLLYRWAPLDASGASGPHVRHADEVQISASSTEPQIRNK